MPGRRRLATVRDARLVLNSIVPTRQVATARSRLSRTGACRPLGSLECTLTRIWWLGASGVLYPGRYRYSCPRSHNSTLDFARQELRTLGTLFFRRSGKRLHCYGATRSHRRAAFSEYSQRGSQLAACSTPSVRRPYRNPRHFPCPPKKPKREGQT